MKRFDYSNPRVLASLRAWSLVRDRRRDTARADDTALGGAAVTGFHTGHRTGDTTLRFAI